MGTPHARAFGISLVWGALLALGACGGAGDGPPGPLARHFDEMKFLGGIPVDQRQAELDAKGEYDKALMLQAKASSDLDAAKVMLDVAKNEREAAKLDEKSAQTRQKAAQDSADMNRIKEADEEMKGTRLAADAADKRYAYLLAYTKWLQKVIRYTEHNTFWREAQYELTQAKLAQKNNIQPQGFVFDHYAKQEADRSKKTADAKQKAEAEKGNVMSARKTWLALQGESDKLLGKKNDYPDPMDPSKVEGVGYTPGDGGGKDSDKLIEHTQDPTMNKSPSGGGTGSQPDPEPEEDEEDGDEAEADPDEGGE